MWLQSVQQQKKYIENQHNGGNFPELLTYKHKRF
jgi:hypothetical protein